VKLAFALSHRAGLNANGVPSFSPGLRPSATLGTPPERLLTKVARATGPYRPATRRTERVRRSVCLRRPFPTVRPAPLSRAGSPAGRASDPCHPCRVHAFAIRALDRPWPSSTCFPYPLPPGQTPITKNSKKYYIAPQEVAKNALAANNPFFRNPARLRLQ
jgi:hypothetical protein